MERKLTVNIVARGIIFSWGKTATCLLCRRGSGNPQRFHFVTLLVHLCIFTNEWGDSLVPSPLFLLEGLFVAVLETFLVAEIGA